MHTTSPREPSHIRFIYGEKLERKYFHHRHRCTRAQTNNTAFFMERWHLVTTLTLSILNCNGVEIHLAKTVVDRVSNL